MENTLTHTCINTYTNEMMKHKNMNDVVVEKLFELYRNI